MGKFIQNTIRIILCVTAISMVWIMDLLLVSSDETLKQTLLAVFSIFCGFLFSMFIFVSDKATTCKGQPVPDDDTRHYYLRYIEYCQRVNARITNAIIISFVVISLLTISFFILNTLALSIIEVVLLASLGLFVFELIGILKKLNKLFKENSKQAKDYFDKIDFE